MKNRSIKNIFITLAILFSGLSFSPAVLAAASAGGTTTSGGSSSATADPQNDPNCNNSSDAGVQKCLQNNQIVKDLNIIVNFLATGVGIVVIGTIIMGGIQYSMAGDNASATGAAKQRIINGLIALAAFLFTYGFLQWLIPGGVF